MESKQSPYSTHRRGPARAAALATAMVVVALLALGAAAVASAAGQSVLTLRTDGDHDALWLVAPDGTATAAGTLPGEAMDVAVSPDGATVAYLAGQNKPAVWLAHGPLGAKTIDLTKAGISGTGGLTWLSADKLMVCGSVGSKSWDYLKARLFTVDVKSGAVESFRNLLGLAPSADPTTGKLIYVRIKKLDNGSKKNDFTPKYRESLMMTSVTGSGAGTELLSDEYRLFYDQSAFDLPQLAPGAEWIMAGRSGSDPEVTYTLYDGVDSANLWLTLFSPAPFAASWAPVALGHKVAFTGVPESPDDTFDDACVYVMDADTGQLLRTPRTLFTGHAQGWLDGVAWADDGSLVVDALDSNVPGRSGTALLVGAGLDTVKDLGEGHLSVWVK